MNGSEDRAEDQDRRGRGRDEHGRPASVDSGVKQRLHPVDIVVGQRQSRGDALQGLSDLALIDAHFVTPISRAKEASPRCVWVLTDTAPICSRSAVCAADISR